MARKIHSIAFPKGYLLAPRLPNMSQENAKAFLEMKVSLSIQSNKLSYALLQEHFGA